jgi:hypothetical protein
MPAGVAGRMAHRVILVLALTASASAGSGAFAPVSCER